MKEKHKKTIKKVVFGMAGGALSAICGAGGGLIIVPFLKKQGLEQKDANRTAVACILPISAFCAAAYVFKGYLEVYDGLVFIPFGLMGAVAGVAAIAKISPLWLKIIFGVFMVYAGVRLLIR